MAEIISKKKTGIKVCGRAVRNDGTDSGRFFTKDMLVSVIRKAFALFLSGFAGFVMLIMLFMGLVPYMNTVGYILFAGYQDIAVFYNYYIMPFTAADCVVIFCGIRFTAFCVRRMYRFIAYKKGEK